MLVLPYMARGCGVWVLRGLRRGRGDWGVRSKSGSTYAGERGAGG